MGIIVLLSIGFGIASLINTNEATDNTYTIHQFIMRSRSIEVYGCVGWVSKLTNERGESIKIDKVYEDAVTYVSSTKPTRTISQLGKVTTLITFQ